MIKFLIFFAVIVIFLSVLHAEKVIDLELNPANGQQLGLVISKKAFERSFLLNPTFTKATADEDAIEEVRSFPLYFFDQVPMLQFRLSNTAKSITVFSGREADEHLATLRVLKEGSTGFIVDASSLIKATLNQIEVKGASHFQLNAKESKAFENNLHIVVESTTQSIAFALVALSEKPRMPRIAHKKVGYFTQEINLPKQRPFEAIYRYHLEVDSNKTVKTPIRYYIDPLMPVKYQQTVKEAVESWNEAFEEIGLANSIQAILPTDPVFPTEYHPADLRYNSISYSFGVGGAVGLGVPLADPRSGEILCSKITILSPVTKAAARDLEKFKDLKSRNTRGKISARECHQNEIQMSKMLTAKSLVQTSVDDMQVLLYAIRDTVIHEVGHSLGLRHNFAGSLAFTKEQLMDPEFTKQNGLSSSIMDYLPLNLWSQNSMEHMTPSHLFHARVGVYDKVAIAYGYTPIAKERVGLLSPALNEIAAQAPLFLTDDDNFVGLNPYGIPFDLSSDPISNAVKEIKFIQKASAHTKQLSIEHGISIYEQVLQLSKYIGGQKTETVYLEEEMPPAIYAPVSREDQVRALEAILEIMWRNHAIFNEKEPTKIDDRLADLLMESLVSPSIFARFVPSSTSTLPLSEYVVYLRNKLWKSNGPISQNLPVLSYHIHALGKMATTKFEDLVQKYDQVGFAATMEQYPSIADAVQEGQRACNKELVYLLEYTSTCESGNGRRLRSKNSPEFSECVAMSSLHNRIHDILYGETSKYSFQQFSPASRTLPLGGTFIAAVLVQMFLF